MRHPVTLLLTAVLAAGVSAGCTSDAEPSEAGTAPLAEPTPLSAYDVSELAVTRSAFCDRIAEEALGDALGGQVDRSRSWAPGDPLKGRGLPRDVAHEFGCEWTTERGVTATAWLFAPPVTRAQAKTLLDDLPRCWSAKGASFGTPSAAIRCGTGASREGRIELGHRGLFGDAWLSCSLSAPAQDEPADLVERAEQWCVQTLEAVRVR